MKKFIISTSFILNELISYAQNLVPNGDFEYYSNCPFATGQINYAPPWYNPNGGQTDYYNSCSGPGFGVPCQLGCIYFQFAHSGEGYAAIECSANYIQPNLREYIQVQLTSQLIANKCYYVEFYVNHSNPDQYSVNNIGAFISTTAISTPMAPTPLGVTPQILLPGNPVISDTLNWTKVYGVYHATGGENYLTIGNFQNDSNTVFVIDTSQSAPQAYYYIDDVSMYEIGKPNAGADTTICLGDSVQLGNGNYDGLQFEWQPTTGLSNAGIANPYASPTVTTTYILQQTTPCGVMKDTVVVTVGGCSVGNYELEIMNYELEIVPNPSGGLFEVKSQKLKVKSIAVFDIVGKKVKTIENTTTADLSDVAKGVYFVEIKTEKGVVNKKVVIQ